MSNGKNSFMVSCIHCKHGTFKQWFHNPIICQCNVFNEKFVAEARRICNDFEARSEGKPIEVAHLDHY